MYPMDQFAPASPFVPSASPLSPQPTPQICVGQEEKYTSWAQKRIIDCLVNTDKPHWGLAICRLVEDIGSIVPNIVISIGRAIKGEEGAENAGTLFTGLGAVVTGAVKVVFFVAGLVLTVALFPVSAGLEVAGRIASAEDEKMEDQKMAAFDALAWSTICGGRFVPRTKEEEQFHKTTMDKLDAFLKNTPPTPNTLLDQFRAWHYNQPDIFWHIVRSIHPSLIQEIALNFDGDIAQRLVPILMGRMVSLLGSSAQQPAPHSPTAAAPFTPLGDQGPGQIPTVLLAKHNNTGPCLNQIFMKNSQYGDAFYNIKDKQRAFHNFMQLPPETVMRIMQGQIEPIEFARLLIQGPQPAAPHAAPDSTAAYSGPAPHQPDSGFIGPMPPPPTAHQPTPPPAARQPNGFEFYNPVNLSAFDHDIARRQHNIHQQQAIVAGMPPEHQQRFLHEFNYLDKDTAAHIVFGNFNPAQFADLFNIQIAIPQPQGPMMVPAPGYHPMAMMAHPQMMPQHMFFGHPVQPGLLYFR